MSQHQAEVEDGKRFEFGKNWMNFILLLNNDKIIAAEDSLKNLIVKNKYSDKSFLDIGSGSGLFSLAARRLGMKVHSFDYDPQSVACTAELKRIYYPNDPNWIVEEGSALDRSYLERLGKFDIVYSWGVLHHTGDMWSALGNIELNVANSGTLVVAIYNDQQLITRYWSFVKKIWNKNIFARIITNLIYAPYFILGRMVARQLTGRAKLERGMDYWRDMLDWLGGYPFEVSKPEKIFEFFKERGFSLEKLVTCGGRHGCNEFVFIRKMD